MGIESQFAGRPDVEQKTFAVQMVIKVMYMQRLLKIREET